MKLNGRQVTAQLTHIPGFDGDKIRRALRIREVRDIWSQLVEQPILNHTNAVYIFTNDNRREMHVYVDESIYAAELNNRRELIKLACREQYGEVLDDFQIHISRGMRKKEYPYQEKTSTHTLSSQQEQENPYLSGQQKSFHLSDEEKNRITDQVSAIPDERLKRHFIQAMIRDLECKKSQS